MAMILITDNPQGGACRCEAQAQAQALDLSNLSPEQVEALKQALGVSEKQAVFDPEKLSEENVVALREKIFDIFSSSPEFNERNVKAYKNLFAEPLALDDHSPWATYFVSTALELEPDIANTVYHNVAIELDKAQEVESLARKLDRRVGTNGRKFIFKSVVDLLLASAVSSDRQIDALKAELAELKAQLNAGQ